MEKALHFLTKGYTEDPKALIDEALFTVHYDEMVIVKDIDVFSLCEHHLLPFYGKAHVAYLPNGKVRRACRSCRGSSTCSRAGCRCRSG